MLLIAHRLLLLSFICSLAVCFDIAYEVSEASFSPVNCKFVCLSAVECYSLNGNYKLASSFVIIAGVVQKRWFISNTSSANSDYLYGAIELNANPWQLKDWKWIGGSKETHAFEPNMKIKVMSSHFTYKNVTNNKLEDGKQRFSLAGHMWLLLAAKDMSSSLSAKQHLHAELKTFEKTVQFHGANKSHNESEHSSTYEYLLQLSYCDYWAHSRAVDLAAECYQCTLLTMPCKSRTFERLNWSEVHSLFRVPPSMGVLSLDVRKSPLLCSDLRNTDSGNGVGDSLLCHWLFGSFRMAAHSLVQSIDPQRALEVVETVMEKMGAQPQWADSNVFLAFSSMRVIARRLLGLCELPSTVVITDVVSDRSHSDLCQWVVRHSVAHSGSEAVHNLFQKLCFQLEREAVNPLPAATNYREITSQAQSLVSSLLGIGAVEVAAVVVANTVSAFCLPPSATQPALLDLRSVLADLIDSYPVLQRYVSPNATDNNLEDVLQSGNVRSALTLYRVFTAVLLCKEEDKVSTARVKRFLTDSDLLTTFLNTLFQATSPVVLDLGQGHDELSGERYQEHRSEVLKFTGWEAEVVVLRATLVSVFDTLLDICGQRSGSNVDVPLCRVNDPVGGIGGRGLFLLAYQGLNLLVPPEECSGADKAAVDGSGSDLLCDWAVPRRYHDLMQVLNPTAIELDLDPSRLPHSSVQSRPLRPKIAFLSFHLTRHSVGRLLAKVIAGIDTAHFDVHIVTKLSPHHSSTSQNDDDVHAFLHSVIPPSHWVYIPLSAEAAVETIRSEGFDAVIYGDVFMDSFVAHLAMSRLAPVQVCFWGHPFTTGYSSMDYFVTSDSFEPANAIHSRANKFSEQLVRFDSLSFQMFSAEQPADGGVSTSDISTKNDGVESSFEVSRLRYLEWVLPISLNVHNTDVDVAQLEEHFIALSPLPPSAQSPTPTNTVSSSSALSSVASQARLYSALQSLFKMHPLFDQAILQILRDDPRAILLLSRNAKQALWQNRLSRRLTRTAAQQNDTALLSRLWFVNQMPHAEYARLLCGVDVSLDTFPFGGGVTLCDAVTGCPNPVPFVTSGELQSVHRIGAGLAAKFNHSGVAVSAPPQSSPSLARTMDEKIGDYVSAAIELASRSRHNKLMGVAVDDIHKVTVSADGSGSLRDKHHHHHHHHHAEDTASSSGMSDIHCAVHDDPQSADEWNRFLRNIT